MATTTRDVGMVPLVTLHSRRSSSGTMTTECGTSHFYTKFNVTQLAETSRDVADSSRHSSASVRIHKLKPHRDGATLFPKLNECAHFHYEFVELQQIEVTLGENGGCDEEEDEEPWYEIVVSSNGAQRGWTIQRSYSSLYHMDQQLHSCIFDRSFSRLPEMTENLVAEIGAVRVLGMVAAYLTRFSELEHDMINCGPVLSWLEMDNRGNRLLVSDNDSAINMPAVGAAYATKQYSAQAPDELTFEIGDIISVIDKPPMDESLWWRGKKEFEVGFFPAECVEMIGEKVLQSVATKIPVSPKPVLRKRGKLISFLRTFFSSRPARTQLRRTGIVRERVFGCDLGEHLLNSEHSLPLVLTTCAEVIEQHGIVDGIYRLSGVASNIQKLRNIFDEDRVPDSFAEDVMQDIHSISSLLKMYFRELPNPLLTYQLYNKLVDAVSIEDSDMQLGVFRSLVRQLPPPHYRTAAFLMKHLARMSLQDAKTGMHCKNLAIVWAPNLLKCKELEQMQCSMAVLQGVGVQAVVTEFLIRNADTLFGDSTQNGSADVIAAGGDLSRPRRRSLASSSTSRLLSLAEAQERERVQSASETFFEVGGGTAALPTKYHTVIDFPKRSGIRKRNSRKKSSSSSWRHMFSRSRSVSLKDYSEEAVSKPTDTAGRSAESDNDILSDEDYSAKVASESSLVTNDKSVKWREVKRKSLSCDIPSQIEDVQNSSVPAYPRAATSDVEVMQFFADSRLPAPTLPPRVRCSTSILHWKDPQMPPPAECRTSGTDFSDSMVCEFFNQSKQSGSSNSADATMAENDRLLMYRHCRQDVSSSTDANFVPRTSSFNSALIWEGWRDEGIDQYTQTDAQRFGIPADSYPAGHSAPAYSDVCVPQMVGDSSVLFHSGIDTTVRRHSVKDIDSGVAGVDDGVSASSCVSAVQGLGDVGACSEDTQNAGLWMRFDESAWHVEQEKLKQISLELPDESDTKDDQLPDLSSSHNLSVTALRLYDSIYGGQSTGSAHRVAPARSLSSVWAREQNQSTAHTADQLPGSVSIRKSERGPCPAIHRAVLADRLTKGYDASGHNVCESEVESSQPPPSSCISQSQMAQQMSAAERSAVIEENFNYPSKTASGTAGTFVSTDDINARLAAEFNRRLGLAEREMYSTHSSYVDNYQLEALTTPTYVPYSSVLQADKEDAVLVRRPSIKELKSRFEADSPPYYASAQLPPSLSAATRRRQFESSSLKAGSESGRTNRHNRSFDAKHTSTVSSCVDNGSKNSVSKGRFVTRSANAVANLPMLPNDADTDAAEHRQFERLVDRRKVFEASDTPPVA